MQTLYILCVWYTGNFHLNKIILPVTKEHNFYLLGDNYNLTVIT